MRVNELLPVHEWQDRALEQADDVELGQQHEGDNDADDDCTCYPEETLTQLLQMIQERHLMARSFAHPAASFYLID